MKKIVTLVSAILFAANMWAQAPNKISYQAVIRNAQNEILENQSVSMRISILKNGVSGTPVYVETFNVRTNDVGLAAFEIGGGTVVSGVFANIKWNEGTYFVKTETDPTGGSSYTISGTSQMLSVPYALHANKADALATPLSFKVSKGGDTLYLADDNYVIVPGVSRANPSLPSVTTNSRVIVRDDKVTAFGSTDVDDVVSEKGFLVSRTANANFNTRNVIKFVCNPEAFEGNITGLTQKTTYYIKAYAKNAKGNVFGNEVQITTNPTYAAGSGVVDIQGNRYDTYFYDGVEWMVDNLHVTKYNDGTNIPYGTSSNWTRNSSYQCKDNDSVNNVTKKIIYYQLSVVESRKVCPTGWHVPSNNEWQGLENFIDPINEGVAGSIMKTNSIRPNIRWASGAVLNSKNFEGVAFGYINNLTQTTDVTRNVYWWADIINSNPNQKSASTWGLTESSSDLIKNTNQLSVFSTYKNAHLIRCVKD